MSPSRRLMLMVIIFACLAAASLGQGAVQTPVQAPGIVNGSGNASLNMSSVYDEHPAAVYLPRQPIILNLSGMNISGLNMPIDEMNISLHLESGNNTLNTSGNFSWSNFSLAETGNYTIYTVINSTRKNLTSFSVISPYVFSFNLTEQNKTLDIEVYPELLEHVNRTVIRKSLVNETNATLLLNISSPENMTETIAAYIAGSIFLAEYNLSAYGNYTIHAVISYENSSANSSFIFEYKEAAKAGSNITGNLSMAANASKALMMNMTNATRKAYASTNKRYYVPREPAYINSSLDNIYVEDVRNVTYNITGVFTGTRVIGNYSVFAVINSTRLNLTWFEVVDPLSYGFDASVRTNTIYLDLDVSYNLYMNGSVVSYNLVNSSSVDVRFEIMTPDNSTLTFEPYQLESRYNSEYTALEGGAYVARAILSTSDRIYNSTLRVLINMTEPVKKKVDYLEVGKRDYLPLEPVMIMTSLANVTVVDPNGDRHLVEADQLTETAVFADTRIIGEYMVESEAGSATFDVEPRTIVRLHAIPDNNRLVLMLDATSYVFDPAESRTIETGSAAGAVGLFNVTAPDSSVMELSGFALNGSLYAEVYLTEPGIYNISAYYSDGLTEARLNSSVIMTGLSSENLSQSATVENLSINTSAGEERNMSGNLSAERTRTPINETAGIPSVQGMAEIGKPVEWTAEVPDGAEAKIPFDAGNISVEAGNQPVPDDAVEVIMGGESLSMSDYNSVMSLEALRKKRESIIRDEQNASLLEKLRLRLEESSVNRKIAGAERLAGVLMPGSVNHTVVRLDWAGIGSSGRMAGQRKAVLRYETVAPVRQETGFTRSARRISKDVRIFSNASVHYRNILSYTDIPETDPVRVHLYWHINSTMADVLHDPSYAYLNATLVDTDSDGMADRVEWVTPRLSEQVFTVVIEIARAEHLGPERDYISDVTGYVKKRDNNWTEPVYSGEYLRVRFEQNLTSGNDITVYARNTLGGNTSMEVYYPDTSERIAVFPVISGEGYYKAKLSGMVESSDVFDIRIDGDNPGAYLEFDHIIDPPTKINMSLPDAGSPGMSIAVQFTGNNFSSADAVTTNSSDIVAGPVIVTDASGNAVQDSGVVLSTVFFIKSTAAEQDVQVTIGGTTVPEPFKIISPVPGSGDFSASSGIVTIGDGLNGTRTNGGTIVLDSLIVPSGVTVVVDTSDPDSDPADGNQGYMPATIIVDGPVDIQGTVNVSGEHGYAYDAAGSHGGAGGPGGGGGGAGGKTGLGITGGNGGEGFTGGGGGGVENGNGGDGGDGTGSPGIAHSTSNGGSGGVGLIGNTTVGGEGGADAGTGGDAGAGGTGNPFGTGGTTGTYSGGISTPAGIGGGGGGGSNSESDGGGGGGFGTAGADAVLPGTGNERGAGGSANGNAQLIPLMGGSGGGGGSGDEGGDNREGGGGGGGGGSLNIISGQSIIVSGAIYADGGTGGDGQGGNGGSGGGGGSGGAVVLQSRNVTISGSISAQGGAGGNSSATGTEGGAGGEGRARVDGLMGATNIPGSLTSEFIGPAITYVNATAVRGRAAASSDIQVIVQNSSSSMSFSGGADANGDFEIAVNMSLGLNYITAIQNTSGDTVSVLGPASAVSYEYNLLSISSIKCEENGTVWEQCSDIAYGDTITAVRANCTNGLDPVSDVSFGLQNVEDSNTFFYSNSSYNSSSIFVYNNTDMTVNDSGHFTLNVTCYGPSGSYVSANSSWTLPWGTLSGSLVSPVLDKNVVRDEVFTFKTRVDCTGGECGDANASAWHTNPEFGTGADGQLTVSSSGTVINDYTYLTGNELSGDDTIAVDDGSSFASGDEVMIIQMQNSTAGSAGLYEFGTISSVAGNTVTLEESLSNSYYSGTFNASASTSAQVIRVPQYTSVTVDSGASITAPAWDGYTGGIVIFRSRGQASIAGSINLAGKGFRAGTYGSPTFPVDGQGGESYNGLGTTGTNNRNDGGGGGGCGDYTVGGCAGETDGTAGGGAGYGTAGTAGSGNGGGQAGTIYGITDLDYFTMGSGGGGGGSDNAAGLVGGAGGSGGGALMVFAADISVTGTISGNGNVGSVSANWAGSGGGGSGGSIFITAAGMQIGSGLVTSNGGTGGAAASNGDAGGNGADGRVRLDYASMTGSSSPASGYNGTSDRYVLVSMAAGDQPFYTTIQNPMDNSTATCLSGLKGGESCETTWLVNATGPINSTWEFLAMYNDTGGHGLAGAQTSRVNITIADTALPQVNLIQCLEPGIGWEDCSNILWGDTIEAVRVNCTDESEAITNATFNFSNIPDSRIFFLSNASYNSSQDMFVYNNSDIMVQDSGQFQLEVTCYDEIGITGSGSVSWTVPWGTLSSSLVSPVSDYNASQNYTFTFTSNVSCQGGECGYVLATIDPAQHWWNDSFGERMNINVTNPASYTADAGYSIRITIDTTSAYFNDDGSDLRIVYWNGTDNIELDRFNETSFNNANTGIWFALHEDIAPGGYDDSYYVYYNNSLAGAAPGDGSNVFDFFDDFNRADSGTVGNGWTESSGTWSILNNRVRNTNNGDSDLSRATITGNSSLRAIANHEVADADWKLTTRIDTANGYTFGFQNGNMELTSGGHTTANLGSSAFSATTGSDYELVISTFGSRILCYTDKSLIFNVTDSSEVSGTMLLHSWDITQFDDVWVRKLILPEPGYALGAPENNSAKGVIPMNPGTPFYTTSQNPRNSTTDGCLADMKAGDSCTDSWSVNATGEINSTWEFYVTYDSMNYSVSGITPKVNITITLESPPVQGTPVLNSTYGTNLTTENITVFNKSTSDANGDDVKDIIAWYKDGVGLMTLNMPFDSLKNMTSDYSGWGNAGTAVNVTWLQSGGHDSWGAYSFNAKGGYITGVNKTAINTSSGTIELWAYPHDFGSPQVLVWAGESGANGFGPEQELHLGVQHPTAGLGQAGFTFFYGDNDDGVATLSGSGNYTYLFSGNLSPDRWYHVVVTWDLARNMTSMYINGTLVDTDDLSGDDLPYGTSSWQDYMMIGRPGASERYFNGTIDDLRIYDRALSAEQVKALSDGRTDMIVSQETSMGETWQACITPLDGMEDGTLNCSNSLQVIGVVESTLPANETIIDRDSVAPAPDSANLTVDIHGRESADNSGINITYYANMTDPLVSGPYFIGWAMTNSSGQAVLDFNPGTGMHAGNYTWWANTTGSETLNTKDFMIYGGLNATFLDPADYPNSSYYKPNNVSIRAVLGSIGPETQQELGSTYNAGMDALLSLPNSTVINLGLVFNGSQWNNTYLLLQPDPKGTWNVTFNASADYMFFAVSENRSFLVKNIIDIAVNSLENMADSSCLPRIYNPILVNVSNMGAQDVYNISVLLYENNALVMSVPVNLTEDESRIVTVPWKPAAQGLYNITLAANLTSAYTDTDTSNNNISVYNILRDNMNLSISGAVWNIEDGVYSISQAVENHGLCNLTGVRSFAFLPIEFNITGISRVADTNESLADGISLVWETNITAGSTYWIYLNITGTGDYSVGELRLLGLDPYEG